MQTNALTPAGTAPASTAQRSEPKLRADFQRELERKLEGWLGRPGSAERAWAERSVERLLTEPDARGGRHIDLSKLEDRQLAELRKLQRASEDFEAVFVKRLLSQMRRSSFSEEIGPMGDMAKDMMDQALAETLSRGPGSIGIGKTIFVDMAQRVVRTVDVQRAEGKDRLETQA